MVNKTPVYLTPDGETKLRAELDELVKVRRPALADRLHKAIQQGDLSENADYKAAKEEQGFLEGRIQQITAMLRNAEIIVKTESTEQVGLGNRVTVVEEGSQHEEVFHVVGSAEADPANGKISYQSPLGEALMGHRVDDLVRVEAPVGETLFRVVAIE